MKIFLKAKCHYCGEGLEIEVLDPPETPKLLKDILDIDKVCPKCGKRIGKLYSVQLDYDVNLVK